MSYDVLGVERWVSEDHPDSVCFQHIIPLIVVLNGAGDPMIAGNVVCDGAEKGFVQCLARGKPDPPSGVIQEILRQEIGSPF